MGIMTQTPITKAIMEIPRIPLLVGVVGHRDLVPDEVPAIRDAADQLLRMLQDAQPDVPVKLLSAQAEGADLVVADVARAAGTGSGDPVESDEACDRQFQRAGALIAHNTARC